MVVEITRYDNHQDTLVVVKVKEQMSSPLIQYSEMTYHVKEFEQVEKLLQELCREMDWETQVIEI